MGAALVDRQRLPALPLFFPDGRKVGALILRLPLFGRQPTRRPLACPHDCFFRLASGPARAPQRIARVDLVVLSSSGLGGVVVDPAQLGPGPVSRHHFPTFDGHLEIWANQKERMEPCSPRDLERFL